MPHRVARIGVSFSPFFLPPGYSFPPTRLTRAHADFAPIPFHAGTPFFRHIPAADSFTPSDLCRRQPDTPFFVVGRVTPHPHRFSAANPIFSSSPTEPTSPDSTPLFPAGSHHSCRSLCSPRPFLSGSFRFRTISHPHGPRFIPVMFSPKRWPTARKFQASVL